MHSCRCALHPALTFLAVSAVGSVVGIGLHLWFEPGTSALAIAVGAIAGLFVSHAIGESVLLGFGIGAAVTLLVLGVRAFASVMGTLRRAPSTRVWFSR